MESPRIFTPVFFLVKEININSSCKCGIFRPLNNYDKEIEEVHETLAKQPSLALFQPGNQDSSMDHGRGSLHQRMICYIFKELMFSAFTMLNLSIK